MPRRWICCASLRQTERRENLDTDLIERAKVTVDDKVVPKRRGVFRYATTKTWA
jgi:hypothetical protein